uniref:BHLH domain-containing protein n=1 Tax=Oryza punctata TaxID=4537 RepID=A0A0E0MPB2_ORYPU
MMSFPYSSGDLGEAAAAAAAVDITLDQMFQDYDGSTYVYLELVHDLMHAYSISGVLINTNLVCYSDDDLFEFVWESCGGGEVDGGAGEMQHAAGVPCCHRLLPGSAPEPPSEDEMAAWLSTIVTGSGGGSDDVRDAVNMAAGDHQDPAVKPDGEPLTEKIDKRLPTRTEERRAKHKARRNPRYAETHGLTEKRRRSKINEKFKMLQQLVPGCDKLSLRAVEPILDTGPDSPLHEVTAAATPGNVSDDSDEVSSRVPRRAATAVGAAGGGRRRRRTAIAGWWSPSTTGAGVSVGDDGDACGGASIDLSFVHW